MRCRPRRLRAGRRAASRSGATRAPTVARAPRRAGNTSSRSELEREAPRVAEQAAALLRADPCPRHDDDRRHRLRADGAPGARVRRPSDRARPGLRDRGRVRGHELPEARRPRLAPLRLRAHEHHGRPHDARSDSGTYAWDDEGVPGERHAVVSAGILEGFLTSRETAAQLGEGRGGSMRADGWSRMPLVRMTNLHLEPGDGSLRRSPRGRRRGHLPRDEQELVDRRQAPELPVRDADRLGDQGRKARPHAPRRDLHGLDARLLGLARRGRRARRSGSMHGLTNCGKGQPGQSAHVSHGTSPARFRNVRVGVRS